MMGAQLDARRRNLARAGRAMTLRRSAGSFPSVTYASVALVGFSRAYRPDPLVGTLIQADLVIEIGQDEITAASWPGPPAKGDEIQADGASYNVEGVETIREADAIIGHRLMVRGS